MDRRRFIETSSLLGLLALLPACGRAGDGTPAGTADAPFPPIDYSREQWRSLLEPARFDVLFNEATEPAGSSPLNREQRDGSFICAACHLPLFASRHKYESGTGWPSFTQPIDPAHVGTRRDWKLVIPRTEYHCARCGGHQGHVFDDGPPPRGERWCNNGLALRFVPASDALPELRA